MQSHNDDPKTEIDSPPAPPARTEPPRRRFRIVKLEERIAPRSNPSYYNPHSHHFLMK